MLNQLRKRNSIALCAALLWSAIGAECFAQWGTNAPVYTNCVICAPQRKSWGYHQTQWNRWPGAIYPDMIQTSPGAPGGEIPPPRMEIPPPAQEAETRIPSPTRPPLAPEGQVPGGVAPGGAGPEYQNGQNGAMPEPSPIPNADFQPDPTPTPSDTPLPDTAIPPPSSQEAEPEVPAPPLPPATEPGDQTDARRPAPQLRAAQPNAARRAAAAANPNAQRRDAVATNSTPPRLSLDNVQRPLPPMTRVRGAGAGRPAVEPNQPELIPPSLSMRPLDTTGHKPRAWRPTANNPFRADAVRPAAHDQNQSHNDATDSSEEIPAHQQDSAGVGITNRLRSG